MGGLFLVENITQAGCYCSFLTHHSLNYRMFASRPFFRNVWLKPAGGAALLLALATGCTHSPGDPAPMLAPCNASAQTATYAAVISPIFDANCRECHASNVASTLGGGNAFGDYQSIKRYSASALLGSIEQAPSYDPMPKGRARISACDIERIKTWMAAGEPNN